MSRIPSVKTWRVSYYRVTSKPIVNGVKRERVAYCHVDTINKRFAKWLARDIMGYPLQYALDENDFIKVTVNRIKGVL